MRVSSFFLSALLVAASSLGLAASEPADSLVRTIRNGAAPRLLSEALEELLDDLTSDLLKIPERRISPLAVRAVRVSDALNANAVARLVEQKLVHRLRRFTRIAPVKCLECTSFTSRTQNGHWAIRRGVVSAANMGDLRRDSRIEALIDLTVDWKESEGKVSLAADITRTADGQIVFAETYDSKRSSAELLRTGEVLKTRVERAKDLEAMLKGKPSFEVSAHFGLMTLPYRRKTAMSSDWGSGWERLPGYGTAIGVKLTERFGVDWRHTFGFEADGYFNFSSVAAAIIGATYWWTFIEPGLFRPDWRLGGSVAAVIVGTEGNTAMFSFGVEARLKQRFSISTELVYTAERNLESAKIGGLGYRARFNVNW